MTQLSRYQPWWLAERRADEVLDALLGARGFWPGQAGIDRWTPACDVFSRDGDLVVELALPGIDPEKDLQVTVQDGVLCISGERHQAGPAADSRYLRREWRYGAFERGITLPDGATGEGITASYRDGVLEVVVPKAAQRTQPRQIQVSAGGKTGSKPLAAPDRAA